MFINIKKITWVSVLSSMGLLLNTNGVFAVPTTEYQITVTRAELCTSAACTTSTEVGSGATTFDIASSTVGAAIGSYASTDALTIGATYTHLRVTMSRGITLTGTVANGDVIGGNGGLGLNDCVTGGGTDATKGDVYANMGSGSHAGGAATPMTVWVPDLLVIAGSKPNSADFAAEGITLVDDDTMQFLIALATPITVTQTPPTIEVNFSITNSLDAFNNGGTCIMFPLPPSVTLVIR